MCEIGIKYDLYELDVWGNGIDGWTVNQSSKISSVVIPDELDDQGLLNYLKEIEFLSTSDPDDVYLVDNGEVIEIYATKDDMPIGQLTLA